MRKILLFLCFLISFQIVNAQWEQVNNGLQGGEVWCFIIDGNNTYTGITGGVFMTTNNGDNWTAKNKGLKGNMGLVTTSLVINGNNIFAGTWYDGIFLSTDKGENWIQKSNGLPYWIQGYDNLYFEHFYTIIISGNNIFAGTKIGVFISTDNGDNWTAKNNGLPQLDTLKRDVNSLAISGNDIFAGTRFGVFMSTDNGENWFAKNKGIENLTVSSLAIKENNIYAGTERGIFLSTDDGDKWKNIGFKDTAIVSITLKWNYIFAAGGFYISSDNGNNWTSDLLDEGVCPIIINGEYVFAGTDHSGVFRAKLSDLGITDVKEQEQTNEIKIFPNPASDEFRLKFHSPIETIVQLSIFDLLSNCVFSQALQSIEGTNEKNINCEKLPQGYYYVKINVNEVVETVPLVIVK